MYIYIYMLYLNLDKQWVITHAHSCPNISLTQTSHLPVLLLVLRSIFGGDTTADRSRERSTWIFWAAEWLAKVRTSKVDQQKTTSKVDQKNTKVQQKKNDRCSLELAELLVIFGRLWGTPCQALGRQLPWGGWSCCRWFSTAKNGESYKDR